MAERLTSGDEGVDTILGGGLPTNGINLITGLPGSGKTGLPALMWLAERWTARQDAYPLTGR